MVRGKSGAKGATEEDQLEDTGPEKAKCLPEWKREVKIQEVFLEH